MQDLINKLDLYFGKKAPQLPKKAKEIIVEIAPYLAIVGILMLAMSLRTLLWASRVNYAFRSFAPRYSVGSMSYISLAISLAAVILSGIAIPGLFKKSKSGWNFSFYSVLVSAAGQILMFNLIGAVISLAIGFYFLFQVKPYYFGGAVIVKTETEPEVKAEAATENPAQEKPAEPAPVEEAPETESTSETPEQV